MDQTVPHLKHPVTGACAQGIIGRANGMTEMAKAFGAFLMFQGFPFIHDLWALIPFQIGKGIIRHLFKIG